MRIAEIRLLPYSLPFHQPFRTARETLRAREGFLVAVRSREGAWGVGEAAPLPAFGTESIATTRRVLEEWRRHLPGTTLAPPPAVGSGPEQSLPGWPEAREAEAPAACHGLEQALLHLFSAGEGMPLCKMLHPLACERVPVNATVGAVAPAEAGKAARAAREAGFPALKVKVGAGDPAGDEARLRAARNGGAGRLRIRADANGAWSGAQAGELFTRWRDLGLEYIEQPVPADDLEAMARLAAAGDIPVAADESVRSAAEARAVLQRRAANLLVLKPMILGGVLPTLAVARQALAEGLPVVLTTSLEGVYGRTGALHAAAALHGMAREMGFGKPLPAMGLATGQLLAADHLPQGSPPVNGHLVVPEAPGLGLPLPRLS